MMLYVGWAWACLGQQLEVSLHKKSKDNCPLVHCQPVYNSNVLFNQLKPVCLRTTFHSGLQFQSPLYTCNPPRPISHPCYIKAGMGEDVFCTCISCEPYSRVISRSNETASTSLVPRPPAGLYLAAIRIKCGGDLERRLILNLMFSVVFTRDERMLV